MILEEPILKHINVNKYDYDNLYRDQTYIRIKCTCDVENEGFILINLIYDKMMGLNYNNRRYLISNVKSIIRNKL